MIKKILVFIIALGIISSGAGYFWVHQPILPTGSAPVAFSIVAGSGVKSAVQQISQDGVPVNPWMLGILARLTGQSSKLKAGNYQLKPGTNPLSLIDQLVRGEFAQESLSVIEGWTFKQMRQAIANHPSLKHDTLTLSDKELLAKIAPDYPTPEGLFFPDTYRFATGASDWQIYKQAHALMQKKLDDAWATRNPSVPYKTPYQALIMASIVEKETGQKSERDMIAAVFVNRLKLGMMLQTDPSVIYGMGEEYQGNIRKRNLLKDTPYNTYTRTGLPPTPIALPGVESLSAAVNPASTDALYFVSRGNGTSKFSNNLSEHNRAVNKYQRNTGDNSTP